MKTELFDLLSPRRGHFRLESGHHGDLWLDLDGLFQHPARLATVIAALSERLAVHGIDAVCGPLTGGAFVAFEIAARRDLQLFPAERFTDASGAHYRIPAPLRPRLAGMRIAIVDDVINAGSAVRSFISTRWHSRQLQRTRKRAPLADLWAISGCRFCSSVMERLHSEHEQARRSVTKVS